MKKQLKKRKERAEEKLEETKNTKKPRKEIENKMEEEKLDEGNKAGVTANQGRSNIHCFFDAIKIIRPADTEANSELVAFLSKTPFWVFIKSCLDGTIDPLEHKNYGRSIEVILSKYNRATNKFSLGGEKVGEISDKDVAELLGLELKDGMLEISQNNYGTNRDKSSVLQKYFEKGQRPKKSTIEFALKKAIKDESWSDVARLVIVHLLASYLFTTTGQAICWNLVHLCENLDEIGNYNWAQAINARLSNSLKSTDKLSLSGCISLVAYWFCEKTNIIDPKEGKKDAKPGLAKWNLQVLNLKWEGTEAKGIGDVEDLYPIPSTALQENLPETFGDRAVARGKDGAGNVSNEHSHDANQTPTYAPTQTQFQSYLDELRESDRGRNEQFTTLVNASIRDLNTQLETQFKSYLDELKEIDRRRDEEFKNQFKSYLDELRKIDRRTDEQFTTLMNAISALSSGPPPPCVSTNQKKLIILDVNGVLAHIEYKDNLSKYQVSKYTVVKTQAIFERPKLREFLEFCFRNFKVAVWSSKEMKNLAPVLDVLMDKGIQDKLLFTWDRSKCTITKYSTSKTSKKPLVLKELRKCWDDEVVKGKYNEFNTLLLDDSPYKALLNPAHTGVFPTTYDGKGWDDELGTLQTYLQNLATAENIPAFVSEHPFGQGSINEKSEDWELYNRIISEYGQRVSRGTIEKSC